MESGELIRLIEKECPNARKHHVIEMFHEENPIILHVRDEDFQMFEFKCSPYTTLVNLKEKIDEISPIKRDIVAFVEPTTQTIITEIDFDGICNSFSNHTVLLIKRQVTSRHKYGTLGLIAIPVIFSLISNFFTK